MRLPVNQFLPLAALILAVTTGPTSADDRRVTPAGGPAADYPVVLGEAFTIGDVTWTPKDQLSYDAVGHGTVANGEAAGVSAAHKTLPLPSYVEVTALGSGRTILIRVERRGPMVNDALLELSPDAASQLGIAPGAHAPIRVRRVNPPEVERAALRSGGRVPERMETPEGLLKVLRRKLADQAPLLPPPSTPPTMPGRLAVEQNAAPAQGPASAPKAISPVSPPSVPLPSPTPKSEPKVPVTSQAITKPAKAAAPVPGTTRGKELVQVGAFSVEANARKSAANLGAGVTKLGKLWHVRMGPFANRAQATAALEKARAAGYSDARIQRAD